MKFVISDTAHIALVGIPVACLIGAIYAIYCFYFVSLVEVDPSARVTRNDSPKSKLSESRVTIELSQKDGDDDDEQRKKSESKNGKRDTQKNKLEKADKESTDEIEDGPRPTSPGRSVEDSGGLRQVPSNAEQKVFEIYKLISDGSNSFLKAEYRYLTAYIVAFAVVVFVVIGGTQDWKTGGLTMVTFVIGAASSILAGFIGMKIATFSNARTTLKARDSLHEAFHVAFKGGCVLGFSLVSIAVGVMFCLCIFFLRFWYVADNPLIDTSQLENVMRALAGFGIGASSVALFARVGGGIYTKAADVGADLVGKVEAGIPEDDPRNPATIADNVGDNVGDIAGMGADLFGSLAGSTCASFVLASQLVNTRQFKQNETHPLPLMFGLCVSASGVLGCALSSIIFSVFVRIRTKSDVKKFLSRHELLSTLLTCVFVLLFAMCVFGTDTQYYYPFEDDTAVILNYWKVTVCVVCGVIGGWLIGVVTEYYTSDQYRPVQELAESCKTGAATNIIYGLSLGYVSVAVPVLVLAIDVFVCFSVGRMYGVALATLGVISTLCTSLSIDAFGPIADNAGGIAEMAQLPAIVRNRTDALDSIGNTTAAIGKGFAIGSAALVGIALLGSFQFSVVAGKADYYRLIDAAVLSGLLVGACLPYLFSALCMKSVGKAALAMVNEVREQFRSQPGIMDGSVKPDYDRCIQISTSASLSEMVAPAAMVILVPLFAGFLFGCMFLTGILAGVLVSAVQMAMSASNTGGAWDNAKKFIEAGLLKGCKGKGTEEHKAAVIGDTVGDPLKDTSGPALNILIKLMGIISVVFAKSMYIAANKHCDGLIGRLFHDVFKL